jgi:diguanylate cyclase (GGDEF)-like protein/PAS domain S-box-containing protein
VWLIAFAAVDGHRMLMAETILENEVVEPSAGASAEQTGESQAKSSRQSSTETRVAEISSLLHALEEVAGGNGLAAIKETPAPRPAAKHENRLVQVRLGMASSLFAALRQKHFQSAEHSLRVALGCSSWALYAGLDDESRDVVELAALLHDIGKIGVPDAILTKPSRLTADEEVVVRQQCEVGSVILAECCGSERVLDSVRYSHNRFDGNNSDGSRVGEAIPLEARMIAIVDAFDSMTTDQVYRQAWSRDRAMQELFEYAGTQFDPQLVKQFQEVLSQQQDVLSNRVAARWLNDLMHRQDSLPWQAVHEVSATNGEHKHAKSTQAKGGRSLFEQKLIDTMHDGVVFVDTQAKITMWNKGAEQITGISRGAATGRTFAPSLLEMCNHGNRRIHDGSCPVARALRTNSQIRQRLLILGRQGNLVPIDLHAIPVVGADGTTQGATVLLHDAQPEATLEERCEALHAEVTRDPLTKVANRAEFDRMQALFIEAHEQATQPCSLIMVDIDHFKSINDNFGHQVGDEAIITVAALLTTMCRAGDLVARYGGEEFAVLCADCNNAGAARRAEEIRKKLAETVFEALGTRRLTASFGVTELQAGDNSETMLRRADRALLMAKGQGRNQVVQLGNGMEKQAAKRRWWWFGALVAQPVIETELTTAVPIDIAIAKLRGFVSDHQAKIISTHENSVELEISSEKVSYDRRKNDRNVDFRIELEFSERRESRVNNAGFAAGEYASTHIDVKIRPRRSSNRRRGDIADRARLILQSVKAYLMAKDSTEREAEAAALGKA